MEHGAQGADSAGGERCQQPHLPRGIHSLDDWTRGVATAVAFGFGVMLTITVEKDEESRVRC